MYLERKWCKLMKKLLPYINYNVYKRKDKFDSLDYDRNTTKIDIFYISIKEN